MKAVQWPAWYNRAAMRRPFFIHFNVWPMWLVGLTCDGVLHGHGPIALCKVRECAEGMSREGADMVFIFRLPPSLQDLADRAQSADSTIVNHPDCVGIHHGED